MHIQNVKRSNFCTNFNGTLNIYNRHKNRWLYLNTTSEQDNALRKLFNPESAHMKKNFIHGNEHLFGNMNNDELLKFMKNFSYTIKGINLPVPSNKETAFLSHIKDNLCKIELYCMNVDNTFKIAHSFVPPRTLK